MFNQIISPKCLLLVFAFVYCDISHRDSLLNLSGELVKTDKK